MGTSADCLIVFNEDVVPFAKWSLCTMSGSFNASLIR